jgi:hypothetical protein
VELSFDTAELREICEKRTAAEKSMGLSAALELEQCLADIEAADTFAEFSLLYPELIFDRPPDDRLLRFTAERQLVFCPGHVKTPRTSTGITNWERVTRLRIKAIEASGD